MFCSLAKTRHTVFGEQKKTMNGFVIACDTFRLVRDINMNQMLLNRKKTTQQDEKSIHL